MAWSRMIVQGMVEPECQRRRCHQVLSITIHNAKEQIGKAEVSRSIVNCNRNCQGAGWAQWIAGLHVTKYYKIKQEMPKCQKITTSLRTQEETGLVSDATNNFLDQQLILSFEFGIMVGVAVDDTRIVKCPIRGMWQWWWDRNRQLSHPGHNPGATTSHGILIFNDSFLYAARGGG